MDPFGVKATTMATAVAVLLSWRAHRKKSLTPVGSVTAFCVGFLLVGTGSRGLNLLVFYQIATIATKYKKDYKATIDGTIATTGSAVRGATQVLACSLLAVLLSLIHAVYCGAERPIDFSKDESSYLASSLTCGVIAHHATCLADTLAAELGILSKASPVLVTQPWRTVPSGTNGGVTLIGLVWSALGGLLIGLSTILFDYLSGHVPLNSLPMVLFATTCGLVGSLVDSFVGATMQQTYWDPDTKLVYQREDSKPPSAKLITGIDILNNEQVNLVSVAVTTGLGGWLLGPLFFTR
jgi:uncharacterized protein (TIGR00297 family)